MPDSSVVSRSSSRGSIAPFVLDAIVSRTVEAVRPLKIILFGSAARDEATPDSDIDVLVVVADGTPRLKTAQLLHARMFGVAGAVDFVVATAADLEKHKDNIGLVYRQILREGREVYAVAQAT